jgi:hypothetical protein
LHVQSGDAGGGSVGAGADDLVVEGDGSFVGLTFLTPDNSTAQIGFADTSNPLAGRVEYDHSSDKMQLYTATNPRLAIDSNGNVGISDSDPVASLTVAGDAIVAVTSNVINDLTFLGSVPPQLTVAYSVPGPPSWDTSAITELVVSRAGDTRVTVLSGDTNTGQIAFADTDNEDQGYVTYDHNVDSLTLGLSGRDYSRIVSTGPLADDSTTTVTPPRSGCIAAMVTDGYAGFPRNQGYFFGYIDVGNSLTATAFNIGNVVAVDTSNTTPTGTTGNDGDVTLFLQDNGTIIVENREGDERSFQFTFF